MGVGLQYILCQYMMYKPASSCIYVCASNFEAPICINLPKHHTQTSSMFGTQTPEPILQTWRTPQQQRGNLSEIEALATSCLCLFSSKMDIFKHRVCIYIYMHMQNYADMISTKILCTSEYPWLGVTIFTKGGPGTSDSQRLFGFEPRTAQNSPAPGMICGVPELGSYAVTVSNPPTFKRYPSCPSHCPSHLGSG